MADFMHNISSPSWWFGVVIIGVLINLLSAYLKPKIDGPLSKVSKSHRARLAARDQRRALLLQSLRAEPHEQLMAVAAEERCRLRALDAGLFGLGSFAFLIVGRLVGFGGVSVLLQSILAWVFVITGAVGQLISLSFERRATRIQSLLFEARDKRPEIGLF